MEQLWKNLESFYQSVEGKMTADRYFEMCEQLGRAVDPDKIPVDFDDLPEIVKIALNIFNKLGDRLASDIGFIGKDYTLLEPLLDTYHINNKEVVLDIITWLESRAIKKSAESLKREHDKIKGTSKVNKRSYP